MAMNLKDAIEFIKSGHWLDSLKVITADLNKKNGGQLLEFKRCRIARHQTMHESGINTSSVTGLKKNPLHNFHFTLNMEMENKELRKIHPILIVEINKQKIL